MRTEDLTHYRYGRVSVIGLSLIAVVASAFAWFGLPSRIFTPDDPVTLRLAAYEGDVGALNWIAQDRGFFQRAGINVVIKGYNSGNAAIEAMRAGEVDVATAADLVVAKRSFDETDLRIVADICRYWNKGMIGRRDHGVTNPAALRGKRIGVPATSSAEHNLMVFLALHEISTSDVTIVDLQPAQLVEAIAGGSIDAAIVWQPHVLAIERRLGANAVTLMEGGTEAHLLLVTREATLSAQPAGLTGLLKGVVQADTWVADHPDLAKAWLANRFALTQDYLEVIWPRMQLAVSLPQEILAAMDSEARWIAKTYHKDTTPVFTETVHAALLMAVKPSAVTVFTK